MLFWAQLVVALLLLSAVGIATTIDWTNIQPLTAGNILGILWPRVVAGLLQALIVLWLFRLIGQKIF
jgi:hypothetical protein